MTPLEQQEAHRKAMEEQERLRDCSARKPLHMYIPPEGTIISCPVHPEGHFIIGSRYTW